MKKETLGNYWILKDKKPVLVDLLEWGKWFEQKEDRIVKQETLANGYRISTVFLGLDHNYGTGTEPVLFETMVFNKKGDDVYMNRYTDWKKAERGHKRVAVYFQHGDEREAIKNLRK